MEQSQEIKPTPQLGHTIKDPISGLQGAATCLVEKMNGNLRFAIQTPSVDGKIGEHIEFDAANAIYIDEGLRHLVQPVRPSDHVILGGEVEDTVTGFVGVATVKMTYLNGCVNFVVEGKVNKKNEAKMEVFGSERLAMIKKPATPPVPASKDVQGGPVSRPMVSRRG